MPGFFKGQTTKTKTPKLPQCGKCGLYKDCISPKMEVTGAGNRKVLFVAEAPGEEEDRQGTQLIGPAGQLLRDALEDIDVEIDDCYTTNSVICRPHSKVEPYMISCCRPNLLKSISRIKPNVIVVMGKSALESLMFKEWKRDLGTINRWVGWTIPSGQYNAWLCPTFHPSYILRMNEDQQLVRIFKEHLKRAFQYERKKVTSHSLESLKSKVEIITDTRKGGERMKGLLKKKGVLAFDYETTGLKPDTPEHKIVSCSFCLNGKDTFATMIDESNMKMLSRILQTPTLKKVASNIKFEERWSRAMFGHGVRGWVWDTMLAAHCLDNRSKITSIKFQSYVHLGIPSYDSTIYPYLKSGSSNGINRIEQADKHELLMYNGLDSLLEYLVAKKQRKQFK